MIGRPCAVLALVLGSCAARASDPSCLVAPGDLRITEIFADHAAPPGGSSADRGHEWIELASTSDAPIDLAGATIRSGAHAHVMGELVLAPRAYVVLGDVDPASRPPWIDYGYGDALGALPDTGGGAIAIACDGVEIDRATYGDATPGLSWQRDATGWCTADAAHAVEFEPGNFGTPGDPNPTCEVIGPGACDDGGAARAIVSPEVGQLAISEWMADPAGGSDAEREWIEVRASADVDLNELEVGGATLDGVKPIGGRACLHVAAGGYAILARSIAPDANGGVPAIARLPVSLANARGTFVIGVNGLAFDRVRWDRATPGRSIQREPGGDVQCDAPAGTPAYDGDDVGTPGAPAAVPCP